MTTAFNEYSICSYDRWSATELILYKKEGMGTAVIERKLKGFWCDIKIPVESDSKSLRNIIRDNESDQWLEYEPDNYEDSAADSYIHYKKGFDEDEKEKIEAILEDEDNSIWEVEDYFRDRDWEELGAEFSVEGPVMLRRVKDGELEDYDEEWVDSRTPNEEGYRRGRISSRP